MIVHTVLKWGPALKCIALKWDAHCNGLLQVVHVLLLLLLHVCRKIQVFPTVGQSSGFLRYVLLLHDVVYCCCCYTLEGTPTHKHRLVELRLLLFVPGTRYTVTFSKQYVRYPPGTRCCLNVNYQHTRGYVRTLPERPSFTKPSDERPQLLGILHRPTPATALLPSSYTTQTLDTPTFLAKLLC